MQSAKCASTIAASVSAWRFVTANTMVLPHVGQRRMPSLPMNPFSWASRNSRTMARLRSRIANVRSSARGVPCVQKRPSRRAQTDEGYANTDFLQTEQISAKTVINIPCVDERKSVCVPRTCTATKFVDGGCVEFVRPIRIRLLFRSGWDLKADLTQSRMYTLTCRRIELVVGVAKIPGCRRTTPRPPKTRLQMFSKVRTDLAEEV